MNPGTPNIDSSRLTAKRWRWRRYAVLALGVLLLYLIVAYLTLPLIWERYARRHPQFDDCPRITQTADKHPGDPLNVAIVGTEDELKSTMQSAGWDPAAALGLRSDLKIAADTVMSRPDDEAPVSSLYLFGRKEDLAFEQPVGDNPRKRHHVRFWRTESASDDGRPIWIGSASYDERVGLSHTTGQITHHIDSDVDAERDHLMEDLKSTGRLSSVYPIDAFQTLREGRNGGGDRWFTDGRLLVAEIEMRTQGERNDNTESTPGSVAEQGAK